MSDSCHAPARRDYLLWASSFLILIGLIGHFAQLGSLMNSAHLSHYSHGVTELLGQMWFGIVLGVIFVGILGLVPRELVISVLGKSGSFGGILRATFAGLLLDLCSHGILMVGMRLYERGASLGQVMAFLIASPWNSLSLTIILIALIGLPWTIAFILLSGIIAVLAGVVFEALVKKGTLPENPNTMKEIEDLKILDELKKVLKTQKYSASWLKDVLSDGLKESVPILKWLFVGVVLASLIRTFVSPEVFTEYFGPTAVGLALTLIAATIIEVCSEGSTPIAAEIFNRAGSPGNSFAFLMTGVSTDYTEIMSIKEKTRSWKIALFLPLVTLPQVIAISMIINSYFTK